MSEEDPSCHLGLYLIRSRIEFIDLSVNQFHQFEDRFDRFEH